MLTARESYSAQIMLTDISDFDLAICNTFDHSLFTIEGEE
jgi:hypothetical protein